MNLILTNSFHQPIAKKICNRISGISNLQSNRIVQLNQNVSTKAIALQHLNGDNSYIEPVYDPEGGDKSNTNARRKRTVINENKMLLFPNPADGFFTVEYNLVDPFNKAVLVVFDMSGKLVLQNEVNYSVDQVIIPSDNWPNGQYTCTLFADGQTILTKQITITK